MRGILVVLVVLSIGAVAAWEHRRGADPGWGFELETVRTWDFARDHAPMFAVAPALDHVAVTDADRQELWIISTTDTVAVLDFEEIVALGAGAREVWVATESRVHRVPIDAVHAVTTYPFAGPDVIGTAAVSAGSHGARIWISHGDTSRFWLSEFSTTDDGHLRRRSKTELPSGEVSLHRSVEGSVIVQERGAPYSARRVDPGGATAWTLQPGRLDEAQVEESRWLAMSAFILRGSEDVLVQWLGDLRSTARLAVLSDPQRGITHRVKGVRSPLGLVHTLGDDGMSILGAQETSDGVRLALFHARFLSGDR